MAKVWDHQISHAHIFVSHVLRVRPFDIKCIPKIDIYFGIPTLTPLPLNYLDS